MNKAIFLLVALGVAWLISSRMPFDPTDDAINKKRSGLKYYKDHGTGCEYIAGPTWLGFSSTPLVKRETPECTATPRATK